MRRTLNACRRRPGFALIAVLAQLTLLFMVWSLANRQSAVTISLEEALGRRGDHQIGSLAALASGLALLETGLPDPEKLDPHGTYGCFVLVPDLRSGDLVQYALTFTRLPTDPDLDEQPDSESAPSLWSLVASPYDPIVHLHFEGPITSFAPVSNDDPE